MDNRYSRNRDLINQGNLDKIDIIGAGGIGSCLIPSVAIMGFKKLRIWDEDILEEHNLSTTMYPEKYLGKNKTEAAHDVVQGYNASTSVTIMSNWNDHKLYPKTIICVDNMETRLDAYHKWIENPYRKFFIDLRMGPTGMNVVSVTKNYDNYLQTWYSSDSIPDDSCTSKHTIFTAERVAGMGLNQVFNILENKPYYSFITVSLTPLTIIRKHLITGE